MRILRISGQGIRSLAEPFVVDFTTGPLAGGGLFAIVGPTGAGKSTLLDAMCLALYGRVPRTRDTGGVKITDGRDTLSESDPRTCLSHGVGEGRAEVLFEAGGGRYISSWKVQRSRKRADGRVQGDRMEFTDASNQITLADKKRDVLKRVKAVTGLDFAQFQRSVLLAQGQFARFLQAGERERASLLETITGQTIYAELSTAAYRRAQSFGKRLDELQRQTDALELPSAEEMAEVKASLLSTGKAKGIAEAEQRKLEAALGWFEERTELALLLATAEQEAVQAAAQWEAFAPDLELLERATRARDLRAEVAAVQRAEEAKRRAVQEQEKASSDGVAAGLALREAKAVRKQSQDKLAELKTQREESKAAIGQARKLDNELAVAQQTLLDTQARAARAEKGAVAALEELSALRKTSEKLAAKAAGIAEWQGANARLKPLLEARAKVEESFLALITSMARETELQAELKASGKAAHGHQEQLAGTEERIVGLSTKLAVALGISGAEETLPLPSALAEALGKERIAASKAQDSAREKLARSEQMVGVEGLRNTLVAGKPCPVCGSREHPGAATEVDDRTLNKLRQAVEAAQVRIDAAENLLPFKDEHDRLRVQASELQTLVARADDALTHHQTQFVENAASAEAARGVLEPLLGPWRATWEADDPLELKDELETLDLAWRARLSDAEEVDRQRRSLEPDLAVANTVSAAAQQDAKGAGESYAGAEAAHKVLQEARAGLLEGKSVEEVLESLDVAEARVGQTLEVAVESAAAARSGEAAAAARLVIAGQALVAAQADHVETQAALDEALGAVGLQADDVTDLLGRGEEWYKSLQEQREKLQNGRATAQQTLVVRQAEVARHEERKDRPEVEQEALGQQVSVAAARVRQLEEEVKELFARLKGMEERQHKAKELVVDRGKLKQEADPWVDLNDLIGSADGSRFRKFAQGLALVQLLHLANQQMLRLKPRYRIERVPETDLEIAILDRDQANQIRPVSSLSGGETFLVSLAMALGLAQLTGGGSPLQSLFIDEGFGALDQESLEDALETLDRLQSEGKTIGIISHIEALRERTACQIEVTPVGAGRSVLTTSF